MAVRDEPMPIKDIQLLLGNDIAGKLVVPNVLIPEQPQPVCNPEPLDLFPSCAVTRSQSNLAP